MKNIALIASLLLLAAACAPKSLSSQVSDAENSNKHLKAKIAGIKKSYAPLENYVKGLESRKLAHDRYLLLSASDIRKLGTEAYLKYAFPAQRISDLIKGTLTTLEIQEVSFLESARIHLRLKLKGKKISIHHKKVPASHKKRIKAGIEKGLIADINLALSVDSKGRIIAKPRCKKIKLLKNNDQMYGSAIRSAINKKFKKMKYIIPVKGQGTPKAVLTTQKHLVIIYN